MLVQVHGSASWQLAASYRGQPLPLIAEADGHWGLVPLDADARLGQHEVVITARNNAETRSLRVPFTVVAGEFPVVDIDVSTVPGSGQALAASGNELQFIEGLLKPSSEPPRWRGTFLLPAEGPLFDNYGERRSYSGVVAAGFHYGTDIGAPQGTPVVATNSGRVILARALVTRGNAVIIDHGFGVYSGYWHLADITVSEGQDVTRGQLIGHVGATGLATGPHLHWEVRIGRVTVDPLTLVGRTLGPR